MDLRGSSSSRQRPESKIQDLLKRVENVSEAIENTKDVCLQTHDSITMMMGPNERRFLADQASASIVHLTSCIFSSRGVTRESRGTGFIIYSANCTLIMTCSHIGSGDKQSTKEKNIQRYFDVRFYDASYAMGLLVYSVPDHDLAIIKVEGHGGKPCVSCHQGQENQIGEHPDLPVFSVSHPSVHKTPMYNTFTMGTVSRKAVAKKYPTTGGIVLSHDCDIFIIDIAANKGCSGAPIFDFKGDLVACVANYVGPGTIYGIGLKSIKHAINCLKKDVKEFRTLDILL